MAIEIPTPESFSTEAQFEAENVLTAIVAKMGHFGGRIFTMKKYDLPMSPAASDLIKERLAEKNWIMELHTDPRGDSCDDFYSFSPKK